MTQTRNLMLTARYEQLTVAMEQVLGQMVSAPRYQEAVKKERNRAKELLRMAQELRELCD